MPHSAAELKDILNIPALSQATDPCATQSSRHLRHHEAQTLSTAAYHHIVAWMRARLDETITEEMLCALSPLGKHGFRRAFARHAGLPPMHYLTWLRVDMAVRLLIDTRFDLAEIAFVTGLRDEPGLVSAFAQTLGVRPHALRVSLA